jgi:AcrR family transcriptional regulator
VTEQRSERLPRAQRREQILAAATTAFARAGFAATSLDDVAREAGISRMIVYQHFDSKRELYQQALDQVGDLIAQRTRGEIGLHTLDAFIKVAASEPDGFRLLFRHAAREPEFSAQTDELRTNMAAATYERIADRIGDDGWARWAAACIPAVLTETVLAWLDAGQPGPDAVTERIRMVITGVIGSARADVGQIAEKSSAVDVENV